MKKQQVLVILTAILSFFANPSKAQESDDNWKFDATPRFWYMMVNPTPFSDSNSFQQTNETAKFPLYGMSVRIEPPRFKSADFLLTAFRGSDSVKGRSVSIDSVSARHVTDAIRTDVEVLFRKRAPESNVHWYIGARWVLLEEETTVGSGLIFPSTGTNHLSEETNFYLAEVGASFSVPIDKTGRHEFFSNLTTGMGYETTEVINRGTSASVRPDLGGYFPFVDINVGYQFWIRDSVSLQGRYRAFVLRETVRDEFVALHGPEVGVTIHF